MEFNTAKVSFKLNTKNISASNVVGDYPVSNVVGSISQFRTSIKWNAINIKNLLGELYNEYELYNIQMECAGYCGEFIFNIGHKPISLHIIAL